MESAKGSRNELSRPARAGLALWLRSCVIRRWLSLAARRCCPSDEYEGSHRASMSDKTTLWPGWIETKTGPLWNHVWTRTKRERYPSHRNDPAPWLLQVMVTALPISSSLTSLLPARQDLLGYSITELHPLLDGIQSRVKPYFLESSPKSPNTSQIL